MPRSTRAQGRPGTQVIPQHWDSSHGIVAAKTMTIPVSLRHPTTTMVFDDDLGYSVPTRLTPYAGANARIQAHRETAQGDDRSSAEESIRVTGYLVTLPLCTDLADLAAGDLIDVAPNACADPLLAGATLRVVDLVRGSLRFERDVFAVINDSATEVTPT